MEAMVWEWPTFIDLWAAGVAGGGFFAAFLIDRFTGRKHKRLVQVATWVGVPLVLLGVLFLVSDLGNQLRFWHLMVRFRPLSPMSIGTWLLSLWAICGVGLIALWLAESGVAGFVVLRPLVPLTEALGWINFVLSPLLTAYTGVLLSNTSHPLWATVLLPVLFVVSAIFTGIAALRFILALTGRDVPGTFGKASLVLSILMALALIGFLLTVPSAVLISGHLALWFWVGVVLIGLAAPFVLDLLALRAKGTTSLTLASTLCVLAGGLVLRALVVIGGQM